MKKIMILNMKRKVFAIIVGLVALLPTIALANSYPIPGQGCFSMYDVELGGLAGVALVTISVGIVMFSQRR